MPGLTEGEVNNIAFKAANQVAGPLARKLDQLSDRLAEQIDKHLSAIAEDRRVALELHAATCPTKAKVDDLESRKKGARATWAVLVAAAALVGGALSPILKAAFLYFVQ